ncbi:hypothetical protein PG993_009562 [Apiospora rasikravindrae]|uniref:NAD-dependent epimerase/dehydratase domain-containing protein n=1 Tax=Apiospora rasikravindrae TaxID=990691 RepID=A0ABR1SK58_9PEZI
MRAYMTSNLGDRPISSGGSSRGGAREFDDATDDIYGYEKQLEAATPYVQRATELGVVGAGLELEVKTLVIMSGLVYGRGTGAFNRSSIQIPVYVRAALAAGRAVVVGQGSGEWDHAHVEDLAELYRIVLEDILQSGGRKLPTGKQGIVFSGNARHTWREVARGVGDAYLAAGRIKDNTVKSVGLEEGAKLFNIGVEDASAVELGLCSNSRTVSTIARDPGWKPIKGQGGWSKGFRDDIDTILVQI